MRRLLALGLLVLTLAGSAAGSPVTGAPRCPVFPADNPWNRRVDSLPVAADSAAIVRSIGHDGHLHADFGSGLWEARPIGIPVTVVSSSTPRSLVGFEYAADESDRVRYPIPANVKIEGGSDRHAVLVDRDACRLYERFALRREGGRHRPRRARGRRRGRRRPCGRPLRRRRALRYGPRSRDCGSHRPAGGRLRGRHAALTRDRRRTARRSIEA